MTGPEKLQKPKISIYLCVFVVHLLFPLPYVCIYPFFRLIYAANWNCYTWKGKMREILIMWFDQQCSCAYSITMKLNISAIFGWCCCCWCWICDNESAIRTYTDAETHTIDQITFRKQNNVVLIRLFFFFAGSLVGLSPGSKLIYHIENIVRFV